jgi:tRNA pseudouridine13 synthase
MKLEREFFLNHSPIEFVFATNSKDFIVNEIPLYDFSGEGEHLILQVRKRNLTTWEMVKIISKNYQINIRDIGYGGLKDRNAMTIQYISIPKKFESNLNNFEEQNIKILQKTYHKNKIKLGHLKGNKFFIRLKKVNPTNANRLKSVIKQIKKFGMANYFGYQRFGNSGDNFLLGKKILNRELNIRDLNKKRLFINSYQSFLFNNWLSQRIKLNRLINEFSEKELQKVFKTIGFKFQDVNYLKKQIHPFKIFKGDVMVHYPHGRAFITSQDSLENDIIRFENKEISPSGLIIGQRAIKAQDDSKLIEDKFYETIKQDGERRYAWVFPEDIEVKYREKEFWFEINFYLPKGSYATTFLEEIAGKKLSRDFE